MQASRLTAVTLLALAACASEPVAQPVHVAPIAHAAPTHGVRCGTVWDPERGAIADGRVVFDGERITAVGAADGVNAPSDELDLRPLFCMPGLVDAHTHLTSYAHEQRTDGIDKRRAEATRNAELTLHAGITSVRDLGGIEGVDLWLRKRIAAHAIEGPRMQCSGSQIGLGGAVGGPAAARSAVDAHVGAGFDVIKLFATGGSNQPITLMTPAEIDAATEEAHARGMRVAVHAITAEGIDASIAAHVDSIEHADELTPAQAQQMASSGIALVPTLFILRYYIEDAEHLGFTAEYVDDLRHEVETLVVAFEGRFPAILATGVKVAMGSDAFMALHGKNARELGYMVRAGMTPEQAMKAATATSAEVLGWAGKVGTLAPGAFADVIAVRGDPRKDVSTLEHVAVVVAGGKVVSDERTSQPEQVR
ncbi:MAG TPA: amidohydrolase family protein [Polyangiaceae bacterium]